MTVVTFNNQITLIHGDMRYTPVVADVCITDAPYRLTSGGNNGAMKDGIFDKSVYNNNGNLFATLEYSEWLPIVLQWLPENTELYVTANDKNLLNCLLAAKNHDLLLHNIITWDRGNNTPNRWYMKSIEFISYFYRGRARPINNMGSTAHISNIKAKKGNRLHPSEKPVELMEYLIRNSTNEGDIVYDPFMGSGSTAIAAIKSNRKFVGVEIDAKYFEIAVRECRKVLNCQNG